MELNEGINKVVAESTIEDIKNKFDAVKDSDSAELDALREEFAKIEEEISSGDWGRIGVMAGVLWYKLDMLVNNLTSINNTLRNIERNTSKIK